MATETMPAHQPRRNILIIEPNPDVREHFGRLLTEVNKSKPLTFTFAKANSGGLRFRKLLRTEHFSATLMNGELGLGLGKKRGGDGDVLVRRLRRGVFGRKNIGTAVISIFGDYRIRGATGIVNNNLTLGPEKSGMDKAADFVINKR